MKYIDLTERQSNILDYIKAVIKERGYAPSVREISDAVGLVSPSSALRHLRTLQEKGYLHRDPSRPRAMELMDDSDKVMRSVGHELVQIPVLGKINAGTPALAEENIEDIFPFALDYLHTNKQLFMLRVSGESMIEVGIEDGDMLIIEETHFARNGDIVVALIENEATVKTFYREKTRFRLQPENRSMEPIYVNECEIIGKPIGLFRHLR